MNDCRTMATFSFKRIYFLMILLCCTVNLLWSSWSFNLLIFGWRFLNLLFYCSTNDRTDWRFIGFLNYSFLFCWFTASITFRCSHLKLPFLNLHRFKPIQSDKWFVNRWCCYCYLWLPRLNFTLRYWQSGAVVWIRADLCFTWGFFCKLLSSLTRV